MGASEYRIAALRSAVKGWLERVSGADVAAVLDARAVDEARQLQWTCPGG